MWEDVKLPEGKVLIPGVITHSTVLVEHPELVAERIVRFASIVGRENVIAGADCGFATFAGSTEIHPSVAWAKLAGAGRRGADRHATAVARIVYWQFAPRAAKLEVSRGSHSIYERENQVQR